LNLQDEEKVTKVSVALPVVKKMKSPKRTLTVKQYPPKRRKLKEKTLLGKCQLVAKLDGVEG
jgi:hypothetical protein